MQVIFEPNQIVCPHCHKQFQNDRVNGLAVIDAVNRINARKRMYIKLALDALETLGREGNLDFPRIKKVILDNFNDLGRDTSTILGIGEDVE